MNMMKKTGGFTLVELIVVIAILAILAGVAVPAYSGYITKANEAADLTWLDSAKTAIAFAVAEEDPSAQVTGATVTFKADTTFSVTANYKDAAGADKTVTDLKITEFVGDKYDTKSDATSAEWKEVNGVMKWELK